MPDMSFSLLLSLSLLSRAWTIDPFQNISLSWDVRVNDLVSRLNVDEIILQLARGGAGKNGPAPAIQRLGIKSYQWNTECLRGDAEAGNATSFPQALGLAASFNTELLFQVSQITGYEVRAKYNNSTQHGDYGDHKGISCFSPVINIMRHPLWGRNQETYGEDPYLTGRLAAAFVQGLQGNHSRYILTNSGCKHFDVHSGPENIPVSRFSFDAKVSERDWRSTYLPAFQACIEAGTYSVMCSYNRINGIPACANKKLLTDILRKEWNFTGYVVSDEGALENIITEHKYLKTPIEAAVATIDAGLNLELANPTVVNGIFTYIPKAIKENLLKEEQLIEAVKPLFYTRMRLGEFDPPEMNPYNKLNISIIQSYVHRTLSLRAAMESFVLLKNENNILPLTDQIHQLAVIGPMADNPQQLFGDYASTYDPLFTKTPFEGLKPLAAVVRCAPGCSDTSCKNYNNETIRSAVIEADLIVVCLGTGQQLESEGNDRMNLDLPGQQLQLLKDAAIFRPNKPIILLLFNAGPLDISWAKSSPNVAAIMECFFPAQATGDAIYNMLTGKTYYGNPAGRLPATWPASMNQVPNITDYSMENRTYRYFKEDPLYPFGYGLSYSTFVYFSLIIDKDIVKRGDNVNLNVTVGNLGKYAGDEVIQIYMQWPNTSLTVPQLQLVDFTRIHIPLAEKRTLNFTITAQQMAVWDDEKHWIVPSGIMKVYAGGQQPNQKTSSGSNVISKEFTISQ